MKINFRIECPYCGAGHKWRDGYINQGWVELTCHKCENHFHTKITIPIVKVETEKECPVEKLP